MRLSSAIPVLRVSDYPRARRFWTEALGFGAGEEGGQPPRFGIFHRDDAAVLVDAWHGADAEPSPGWRAYLHVDDVDALGATLGGATLEGPRDAVHGMRELLVSAPDGNRICFGRDIA